MRTVGFLSLFLWRKGHILISGLWFYFFLNLSCHEFVGNGLQQLGFLSIGSHEVRFSGGSRLLKKRRRKNYIKSRDSISKWSQNQQKISSTTVKLHFHFTSATVSKTTSWTFHHLKGKNGATSQQTSPAFCLVSIYPHLSSLYLNF